jgi:hypothetical protein
LFGVRVRPAANAIHPEFCRQGGEESRTCLGCKTHINSSYTFMLRCVVDWLLGFLQTTRWGLSEEHQHFQSPIHHHNSSVNPHLQSHTGDTRQQHTVETPALTPVVLNTSGSSSLTAVTAKGGWAEVLYA